MAYITVGTGEGAYQVWVDDPVPARSDPELPQPSPPQRVQSPAPPPTVPVVPGTLNASGNPQFVQGTPEFVRADQLARQESRADLIRALEDNGLIGVISNGTAGGTIGIDAVGTAVTVNGRTFIELPGGRQVDITDYFEGNPKPPVAIDISVPTYGTSNVTTPFRQVTVTALPEVARTVNTSEGAIVVDPNSETARFIQWQGSQPDPTTGRPIRETWARQGIADPYSNPTIVGTAVGQIDRADDRTALFNRSGVNPPLSQIAPWNDPNWPAYQGSNREAYGIASAALADANLKNQLKAENGWDEATFQSWALNSTNPELAASLAAINDAAAGLVAGPVSGSTTGLSANGATAVTTTGAVNSAGFSVSSATAVVATAGAVSAAVANLPNAAGVVDAVTGAVDNLLASVPSIPTDLAGIATGFAAGFTDALPELPSITGALQLSAAQVAGLAQAAEDTAAGLLADIKRLPAAIPDSLSPYITAAVSAAASAAGLTAINDLLVRQNATIQKAKEQATLEARNNTAAGATDWRVRLQLAEGADYLYKDDEAGILAPLFATNGVIFPYTPSIETAYTANYDKYDLTHSNYRGYFYKNSAVNDINIRGTFTAQDTFEADYLLAVIHFFRSITKMFYGQGDLRGSPPPLVYLSGFGDYQFNKHPCLVSNFSYSLPNEVDYIRAGAPNNYGNLFSQRAKSGGFSTNPFGAVLSRLTSIGVPLGAEPSSPTPGMITQNVNNLTGATYVPTKIEINVTLLPTNTRAQVSQQFSLKKYADGSLIKGGYW